MIIQHIFSKNSCRRIKLRVSVREAFFHQSDFYLGRTLFINPASTYTVFFSLIQVLLNKSRIYAVLFSSLQFLVIQYCFHHSASVYTTYSFHNSSFYLYIIVFITPKKIFSSLHLLFIQCSFHSSSLYVYSILFINPASIYTVFFSSILCLYQLRIIFNKSHFCGHKFSSFPLLFTQRII